MGELNDETQEYESVIVFEIDKGIVKIQSVFPLGTRSSRTWNGLE